MYCNVAFIDINLPEAKRWLLISNVGRPRCFPDFPMGRNRWILSKERWWKLVTQFWGNHHASLNMFLSMLVAKVWGYHHTPLYSFSSIRDTISSCWGPHPTYIVVLVGFKWSKNRVSFLIIFFVFFNDFFRMFFNGKFLLKGRENDSQVFLLRFERWLLEFTWRKSKQM